MPKEFHLDPEVQQIAQGHIEQLGKLEDKEAKRVLKKYKEIRHELRDRLDALPRGSFSAQQMRGVMVQVDMAIAAMKDGLKEGIQDSSKIIAGESTEHLVDELNHWNKKFSGAIVPLNVDAVAVATETSNFLFNKQEASVDAYSESVRSMFASEITNAAIEQVGLSELTHRIGQKFLGEEWKLLRMARTELHGVYNIGKINSMTDIREETLPDLLKTLMHPMDTRTGDDSKKAAKLNLIVPVDEPFVYEWQGETRSFMAPPDRPNDRAILVPYRKEWGANITSF